MSLNKQCCLWPNVWYCGTKLITENLVCYQFTESFQLTIPKCIDVMIINYKILNLHLKMQQSRVVCSYRSAGWGISVSRRKQCQHNAQPRLGLCHSPTILQKLISSPCLLGMSYLRAKKKSRTIRASIIISRKIVCFI